MFAFSQWLLCSALILSLPLARAQLTQKITSPGNPFIITITITNPTPFNISVLKWNNVFDDKLLIPPSFTVKDDQGNDAIFATTYAMRSGITNADFYTLTPGANISRIYDLRQFLQYIPSGPSRYGPKTIEIIPPTSFQGIVSNQPLNIPAEAAANLSNGQLGNYSAAGLQTISSTSMPYEVALNFPIYQDSRSNVSVPADGVQLDTGTCQGSNATSMTNFIADANIYATAVHAAAGNLWDPLYPQFFQNAQRPAVKTASIFASLSLRGNSRHVDAYCSDPENLCDAEGSILGYTFTPSFLGSSYIVLCPAAMNLGRAAEPCATPAGKQVSASGSHVLFHLLMTINNVVNSVIGNNYYGAQAAVQVTNSTVVNATQNADSYAQLGVALWAYGEGDAAYSGPSCLPANGLVPTNQKRDLIPEKPHQRLSAPVIPRGYLDDIGVYGDNPNNSPEQIVKDAQQCTGDQLTLLQNAGPNVRALAEAGRDNVDNDLWKQIFNGDATVKGSVIEIFDIIANWNTTGNDAGVKYLCDPTRKTLACRYGTKAAGIGFPSTKTAYMLFCPAFFYQPATLECEVPSTYNNYISEIAGSILTNLLYIRWLVNKEIGNGFTRAGLENACFEWNCATSYAQNRVLPDFDERNLPENVASNYVYYAYAARAQWADCSWTSYIGSMFGLQG